ncbi:MAG: alanine racemase [Clostridia bacterium]|nr:alanine racemase [Clostridia bacterium]
MKTLVIKKEDLTNNINEIKKFALKNETKKNDKEYEIIAVVKGNGYGIGLIQYASVLVEQGIHYLAVSSPEEAIEIKKAGINANVILLASICNESEVKELIENDVILTIGSKEAAIVANKLSNDRKVRAHIKIDTGFGRYGFKYSDTETIIETYKNYPNLQIEGTFSHFSESFKKNGKYTKLQFDRFMSVIDTLKKNDINPGMLHICNSFAFLNNPSMHLDASRIGSALVGRVGLRNDISLKKIGIMETKICELKMLKKGEPIRIL